MGSEFLIAIGLVILLGVGVWAAFAYMKRVQRRRMYQAFARASDLQLTYAGSENYHFEGSFQGYPLRIEPLPLPDAHSPGRQKVRWVKLRVPLTNPNKKYLRIVKGLADAEWLPSQDSARSLDTEIGEGLSVEASDLMFSSILLTEAVKVRARHAFLQVDRGIVSLRNNEIAAIIPEGLDHRDQWKAYAEMMQLVADMKNALNP